MDNKTHLQRIQRQLRVAPAGSSRRLHVCHPLREVGGCQIRGKQHVVFHARLLPICKRTHCRGRQGIGHQAPGIIVCAGGRPPGAAGSRHTGWPWSSQTQAGKPADGLRCVTTHQTQTPGASGTTLASALRPGRRNSSQPARRLAVGREGAGCVCVRGIKAEGGSRTARQQAASASRRWVACRCVC